MREMAPDSASIYAKVPSAPRVFTVASYLAESLNKTAWDLEIDESYVLGSAATTQGGTKFQQGADIMIPDSSIAPRHAVLFSKDGRFYIARHPEASGAEGIAKYVLRIKGKTVVASQELHPGDDVMIGRTALRFESRKQGE